MENMQLGVKPLSTGNISTYRRDMTWSLTNIYLSPFGRLSQESSRTFDMTFGKCVGIQLRI